MCSPSKIGVLAPTVCPESIPRVLRGNVQAAEVLGPGRASEGRRLLSAAPRLVSLPLDKCLWHATISVK